MPAVELPAEVRALHPFESRWFAAPGGRMHYVDEGPRDAQAAVICIHGNPTWSFYYREIIRALAPKFRVLAPDHLGCGLSDKPQNWSYRLADHVENLARLLDSVPQRTLHFVVHDWGGPIGLAVAQRLADRVGRLVVANTAAFPGPCPLRIRVCRAPLLGPLLVRGLDLFAGGATRMAVARPLAPAVARGLTWPYRNWRDRVAVLRFVQDIPLAPTHPSAPVLRGIEAGLEKLRGKPMLLAWGMRDFCFTPAFLAEWRRRFPDAEVREFADAGHYVFEDAASKIVPGVAEFLGR